MNQTVRLSPSRAWKITLFAACVLISGTIGLPVKTPGHSGLPPQSVPVWSTKPPLAARLNRRQTVFIKEKSVIVHGFHSEFAVLINESHFPWKLTAASPFSEKA